MVVLAPPEIAGLAPWALCRRLSKVQTWDFALLNDLVPPRQA